MQKLSYLITIRGIKRMMNDILSDQRQIVLQDLCKNFIPCFLEKFNDVLTQNPASPFSRRIQIDELKTLDDKNREIKIKQSGISIYAPTIYQEFSNCLLNALREKFGKSYTITLESSKDKALDKDIYGRDTPMWRFCATYTFTRIIDKTDNVEEQVDADFLFQ